MCAEGIMLVWLLFRGLLVWFLLLLQQVYFDIRRHGIMNLPNHPCFVVEPFVIPGFPDVPQSGDRNLHLFI
jgi:hypothetical protein